jgi:hypothetical protein
MNERGENSRRLVAGALLAVAILLALFIATGGSLPSFSSPSSSAPPAASGNTPAPQPVQGSLTVSSHHLHGDLWSFAYTIHNSGKVPIAGVQINGPAARLSGITQRPLWNAQGAGVCKQGPQGILIYWSTGSSSSTVVSPGKSLTLSFQARTRGVRQDGYSLSWDGAAPVFGKIAAPAAGTVPVSAPCR